MEYAGTAKRQTNANVINDFLPVTFYTSKTRMAFLEVLDAPSAWIISYPERYKKLGPNQTER